MPVCVFCGAHRLFSVDVNDSGCPVYDRIISANFKESAVVPLRCYHSGMFGSGTGVMVSCIFCVSLAESEPQAACLRSRCRDGKRKVFREVRQADALAAGTTGAVDHILILSDSGFKPSVVFCHLRFLAAGGAVGNKCNPDDICLSAH